MKKSLLFSLVLVIYFFNLNLSRADEPVVINMEPPKVSIEQKTVDSIGEKVVLFDDEFENELKIIGPNYVGYENKETGVKFLTDFDDIYLLDDYIKVKKNGKYGLLDKQGNTILMPIFERVGIYKNNEAEYLSVKIDGKNKLYTKKGTLIPEEDLFSVTYDGIYALAKDLKPEFKKYILKNKANAGKVFEIEEVEQLENVQVAAVEKIVEKEKPSMNIFKINNKDYILASDGYKYGISSINNDEILPVKFDEITVTTDKKPVIIAKRNGIPSVYNLNGKLLAEQVYDKVNIYKFGKLYTYTNEDNSWVLRVNGKELGTLQINENDYTFEKSAFTFFKLDRIHKLFINLIK